MVVANNPHHVADFINQNYPIGGDAEMTEDQLAEHVAKLYQHHPNKAAFMQQFLQSVQSIHNQS